MLKHNHNKNKRNSIANSVIRESIESLNKDNLGNNTLNSSVGRSNTTTNASYHNLNSISKSNNSINKNSNNNVSNSSDNVDSHKIKSNKQFDSALNINSNSNSSSVSNTINVIGGLKHRDSQTMESKELNVRSSQIYTIPKTFLNKDLENTKDSDNNEEDEADINEDSSGEILYMSFDRKSKRRNTQTELDDMINKDDNNSLHESPKEASFDI